MKRFKVYSNYEAGKLGKIALTSFIISLIFKGRKKDGKHKNIFIRYVRNFSRISATVGLASAVGAKNAVNNKDDSITFEQAAKIYNESAGETVIDIEYDKNGIAKNTGKSTKTYSDTKEMTLGV